VERNKIVGREWSASGVVIPASHTTSSCSLNAVRQSALSFAGINPEQNFILLNSGLKHSQNDQNIK
jgi:hypothetical protein